MAKTETPFVVEALNALTEYQTKRLRDMEHAVRHYRAKVADGHRIESTAKDMVQEIDQWAEWLNQHLADTGTLVSLAKWAAGADTGASSTALARAAMGVTPSERDVPKDADDFGRCVRLIQAVPAVHLALSKAAEAGPRWAALVGRWDEFTEDYFALLDGDERDLNHKIFEMTLTARPLGDAP